MGAWVRPMAITSFISSIAVQFIIKFMSTFGLYLVVASLQLLGGIIPLVQEWRKQQAMKNHDVSTAGQEREEGTIGAPQQGDGAVSADDSRTTSKERRRSISRTSSKNIYLPEVLSSENELVRLGS